MVSVWGNVDDSCWRVQSVVPWTGQAEHVVVEKKVVVVTERDDLNPDRSSTFLVFNQAERRTAAVQIVVRAS